MQTNTIYRAGWGWVILLCLLLACLFGLANRAGAAEPADTDFTFWGQDAASGDWVELLKPEFYRRADEAAGAGNVVGTGCQWEAGILADAELAKRGAK